MMCEDGDDVLRSAEDCTRTANRRGWDLETSDAVKIEETAHIGHMGLRRWWWRSGDVRGLEGKDRKDHAD